MASSSHQILADTVCTHTMHVLVCMPSQLDDCKAKNKNPEPLTVRNYTLCAGNSSPSLSKLKFALSSGSWTDSRSTHKFRQVLGLSQVIYLTPSEPQVDDLFLMPIGGPFPIHYLPRAGSIVGLGERRIREMACTVILTMVFRERESLRASTRTEVVQTRAQWQEYSVTTCADGS